MATVLDAYLDLLTEDRYATFVTISPDGFPHLTVTWVDYDGEHVMINTARDTRKVTNVEETPVAGINVLDPDHHHRYLSIAGSVADVTGDNADEHATELGRRYRELGENETFEERWGDSERRIVRVRPDRVTTLHEDIETLDD